MLLNSKALQKQIMMTSARLSRGSKPVVYAQHKPLMPVKTVLLTPMKMFSSCSGTEEWGREGGITWTGELNWTEQLMAHMTQTNNEGTITLTMEMDAPVSLGAF